MAEPRVHAQPDRRSCGAACLVVARALADPAYAARVADPAAFRADVLAAHRSATGTHDAAGRLQVPWPRALGTPPWAVARGLAASQGTSYALRRATYDELAAAAPGRPVALYVGSRWLPRHVVLVVGTGAEALRVYEPSSGRFVTVPRAAVATRRLRLAGWDRPWFSVAPRARRTRA